MTKMPLWVQILSEKKKKLFGFKVGPTIPFLIGIYHFHKKLDDNDLGTNICLYKVFHEILETSHNMTAGITPCPHLGVDVIRKAILPSHNPITASNLDKTIDKLWKEYGKYITAHRFSVDRLDHSWREFTKEEIRNIQQLSSY